MTQSTDPTVAAAKVVVLGSTGSTNMTTTVPGQVHRLLRCTVLNTTMHWVLFVESVNMNGT